MSDKKHSPLGSGLSSLIRPKQEKSWHAPAPVSAPVIHDDANANNPNAARLEEIPPHLIDANRSQPRVVFEPEALKELTESIREHGVLEPIVVTVGATAGRYELVAGERRLRAAILAGLPTIPAVVRTADALERLELALIENIQRQDLNALEEAEAYTKLMDDFSLTQEEVARRVGKSRPVIANTLRLLKLPSEVQSALASGQVSAGHARALLALPSEDLQREYLKRILKDHLTVRDVEYSSHSETKKARRSRDPNLEAYVKRLRESLGTKVDIQKTPSGGRVVITFYAEEELKHIVGQIAGELD